MNVKPLFIGIATTAAITTAASADFVGFEGVAEEVGDYTVIKMYAVYDQADIALNVFDAQIVTKDAGGFHHSDAQIGTGGSWSPNASLDIPGFADSTIDSFVTIGYGVGAAAPTNGTNVDIPNGPTIPSGSGWFNGNPTNDQVAQEQGGYEYAVWVGQFSFETSRVDAAGAEKFFIFDCEMTSKNASSEVFFGGDSYIWTPTPGALALLGLGGLTTRRRKH